MDGGPRQGRGLLVSQEQDKNKDGWKGGKRGSALLPRNECPTVAVVVAVEGGV